MKAGTELTTEDTEDTEKDLALCIGRKQLSASSPGSIDPARPAERLVQGMRSEAVGHAAGPGPGIAAGENVHPGVAHDQGLLGRRPHFPQDGLRTFWIGLLGGEAVTAVNQGKELAQPEGLDDRPRRGSLACSISTAILRGRPLCEFSHGSPGLR